VGKKSQTKKTRGRAGRPSARGVPELTRELAAAEAFQLLLLLAPPAVVLSTVARTHTLTQREARAIVSEAQARVRAHVAEAGAGRRDRLIAALEALFTSAVGKGQYASALAAARDIASLEGWTGKPAAAAAGRAALGAGVAALSAGEAGGIGLEMAGRSDDDLEFFATHGCWPEDAVDSAGETVQPAKASDGRAAQEHGKAFPV